MKIFLSCSLFKIKAVKSYLVKLILLMAISSLLNATAYAVDVHPSDLLPSSDTSAVLTLGVSGQEVSISMAEIESLPLFDTEDMVHFDGPQGRFSGIWLDDLLIKYGLNDSPRLRFIAIDGYEVFIPKESIERKRYLIATRLNRQPISAENLGPLLLIIPADAGLASHLSESKNYWVWALNEILSQ